MIPQIIPFLWLYLDIYLWTQVNDGLFELAILSEETISTLTYLVLTSLEGGKKVFIDLYRLAIIYAWSRAIRPYVNLDVEFKVGVLVQKVTSKKIQLSYMVPTKLN